MPSSASGSSWLPARASVNAARAPAQSPFESAWCPSGTPVAARAVSIRASVAQAVRADNLCARVRSVRSRSYPRPMTVGIVLFGLVFLGGLMVGTKTRRPLAIAAVIVGAFCALLVIQTNEPFVAFAAFALIALAGLVVDSVRETVGLLLGR